MSNEAVKIIMGTTYQDMVQKVNEFKSTHNVVKVIQSGNTSVVKWVNGAVQINADFKEVPDGEFPF